MVSFCGYSKHLRSRFYPLCSSFCHGSRVGITIFYSCLLQIHPECPQTLSLQKSIHSVSSINKSVSFHLGSYLWVSSNLQWHAPCNLSSCISPTEHVDLILLSLCLSLTFIFLVCISAQSVCDYYILQDS